MLLYLGVLAFTVWMAVEAVRRGDAGHWLWIIIIFPPIGGIVYFFAEYLGGRASTRFAFRVRKVTAADVRTAEVEVRRLDNAASWTEYASLLRARGDYRRAAEAALRALERDPQAIDARYELGLALLSGERWADAAEALRQVVAQDRSHDSDDALFALGRALQQAGDLAGAREALEELATRRGRPEILFDLGSVQAALGDREAAKRSMQRIVDEAVLVPDYLKHNVRPWVRRAQSALRRL
jgi:hypothetical protein